jgi:hypothetical protein
VDSTSSEASQVIAACAAYGKMYHNANELYMSLG